MCEGNPLLPEDDAPLLRRAKSRALYLLEASDKTEQQLRERLAKNYPEEIVAQVLAYVKACQYIDDARYARNYIESHRRTKSKRVICMELQQKGIARPLLEELDELFSQEDEQALLLQLARRQMEKKQINPASVSREEKQKLYQYLLRRGFSFDAVTETVQKILTE